MPSFRRGDTRLCDSFFEKPTRKCSTPLYPNKVFGPRMAAKRASLKDKKTARGSSERFRVGVSRSLRYFCRFSGYIGLCKPIELPDQYHVHFSLAGKIHELVKLWTPFIRAAFVIDEFGHDVQLTALSVRAKLSELGLWFLVPRGYAGVDGGLFHYVHKTTVLCTP